MAANTVYSCVIGASGDVDSTFTWTGTNIAVTCEVNSVEVHTYVSGVEFVGSGYTEGHSVDFIFTNPSGDLDISIFYVNSNGFTGDISGWDLTKLSGHFYIHYSSFTGDLSGWDVSTIVRLYLRNNSTITGDISGWDLSSASHLTCESTGLSYGSNQGFRTLTTTFVSNLIFTNCPNIDSTAQIDYMLEDLLYAITENGAGSISVINIADRPAPSDMEDIYAIMLADSTITFTYTDPSDTTIYIDTATDLEGLGTNTYTLAFDAELIADIDLVGVDWTAIGDNVTAYSGIFDGKGYTISNLDNDTVTDNQGLFGVLEGTSPKDAVIKNVILQDAVVNNGGANDVIGSLCGIISEFGIIQNCKIIGGSVTGANDVGGLCGEMSVGSVTIQNCQSDISVNGNNTIGGLVGYLAGGLISNCYTISVVSGNTDVGSLVGFNNLGTVTSSYYNTSIDANEGEGTALVDKDMTIHDFFKGWDFVDTWKLLNGRDRWGRRRYRYNKTFPELIL